MANINYEALGELFPPRSRIFKRAPLGYKRFERAAEAIRYAIEELPPELLLGASLEIEEERFDGRGIRALYDSPDYPLSRAKAERAKTGRAKPRQAKVGQAKVGQAKVGQAKVGQAKVGQAASR